MGQILGDRIALQSCSSFNTFWFIFLKSHTLEQKMSLSRLPGESSALLHVTLSVTTTEINAGKLENRQSTSEDTVAFSIGPNQACFGRFASLLLLGWQFVI